MKKLLAAAALVALLAPVQRAWAQEWDVTRRTYPFLDHSLVIHVVADAAGELHVVRGSRGRVEVAARSNDGFPGFGLGGYGTPELRLTAVGAEHVQYLVVVPERVNVTVQLPGGGNVSLASGAPAGRYRWEGAGSDFFDAAAEPTEPLLPTMPGGLYLVHYDRWAPAVVDVPDLSSVRSLSVRFELGGDFRVASSRPLAITPGDEDRLELRLGGAPLDIVIYVPRSSRSFTLRSGGVLLAEAVGGRARALCTGVVVQKPTAEQDWLTFRPEDGRLNCRGSGPDVAAAREWLTCIRWRRVGAGRTGPNPRRRCSCKLLV